MFIQKECLHFSLVDGLKDLNINDMIVSNHGGVASDRGLYQLNCKSNQKNAIVYIYQVYRKKILSKTFYRQIILMFSTVYQSQKGL